MKKKKLQRFLQTFLLLASILLFVWVGSDVLELHLSEQTLEAAQLTREEVASLRRNCAPDSVGQDGDYTLTVTTPMTNLRLVTTTWTSFFQTHEYQYSFTPPVLCPQ